MKREGIGEERRLAKETRGTCITNCGIKIGVRLVLLECFIDYLNKFSERRSE